MPGTRLLRFVRAWFDERTVASVFEPLVADWQHEYLDAGTPLGRCIVRARGAAAVLVAVLRMSPTLVAAPTPAVGRSIAFTSLVFVLVPSAILLTPFVSVSPDDLRGVLLLYLWPSAIGVALPFAATAVALRLSQIDAPAWARRQALAQWVLVALIVQSVGLGLLVPAANQEWRERAAAVDSRLQTIPRGPRELTIVELLRSGALPADTHASDRHLSIERHNRVSMMLAPLFLAMVGWSIGKVIRPAGIIRVAGWWLLVVTMLATLRLTDQAWGLSRPVAVWLPLAVALAGSWMLRWLRSDNPRGLPPQTLRN